MLHGPDFFTVRIPPVHEITAEDMPHLERLLPRVTTLISQPIRDGYHGLPLGSSELAARLHPTGRTALVPVVRFAGLYPTQAIIRPPSDLSLVPPVVPYHDLRIVAEAADRLAGVTRSQPTLTREIVRRIGDMSVNELRKREQGATTVTVSDLFEAPTFSLMRTINHPGNAVWSAIAARLRGMLDLGDHSVDPGRELLNSIHAPREQAVVDAYNLDTAAVGEWLVGESTVSTAEVRDAHLRWYADNPEVVEAGITRHRAALDVLGLLP
ncbi:MAG: peptide transporter ATPase [Glaciihabitans sp.]|nr:peptide transporter ATPase [Glaciihabitans sp.]